MVVWFDEQRREQAEQKLESLMADLAEADEQLKQALLMQLTEKLLQSISQENVTKILGEPRNQRKKRRKRKTS